jgi:hypothetical protein
LAVETFSIGNFIVHFSSMLVFLCGLVLSEGGWEAVELTNDDVSRVLPYALASVRTLFPDAPARGEYPEIPSAELQIVSGFNVRFRVVLLRGVEFHLTIYSNLKSEYLITAITPIDTTNYPVGAYKFESVDSVGDRILTALKAQLAAPPYNFHGEVETILAYRSQATSTQNHNLIFQDGDKLVHSVVLRLSSNDQLTISSWKTVAQK